jgi:hypothetical protein
MYPNWEFWFENKLQLGPYRGDQIGLIFASWAIVQFGLFFKLRN